MLNSKDFFEFLKAQAGQTKSQIMFHKKSPLQDFRLKRL